MTPLTPLSFTPAPEASTSASDSTDEPLEPASNRSPFAPLKSTSTTGAAAKPGAVVPSMSTSPMIFGSALDSWIDPATLKLIVSAPAQRVRVDHRLPQRARAAVVEIRHRKRGQHVAHFERLVRQARRA